MPANRTEITKEQYLEARLIIATVEANTWWEQNRLRDRPVERSAVDSSLLNFSEAQQYTKFKETKFRALMREKKLPKAHFIEGKNLWMKEELDKALSKLVKNGRQSNGDNQQAPRRPKAD